MSNSKVYRLDQTCLEKNDEDWYTRHCDFNNIDGSQTLKILYFNSEKSHLLMKHVYFDVECWLKKTYEKPSPHKGKKKVNIQYYWTGVDRHRWWDAIKNDFNSIFSTVTIGL